MESLQAIFIVISDPGKREKVLKILLECEIRGATIIETLGMSQALDGNIPVIGSLKAILTEKRQYNQTIFAVSKHPEKIDKAVELISAEFNDFKAPYSGMLFVVPVIKAVGIGHKDSPTES